MSEYHGYSTCVIFYLCTLAQLPKRFCIQALQIRYCCIIYCFCIREVKYPTHFFWLFLVIEARHLEAKDANGNYACSEVAKKHSAGRLINKPS